MAVQRVHGLVFQARTVLRLRMAEKSKKKRSWLTPDEEHRMFAAIYTKGVDRKRSTDPGAEILLLLDNIIKRAGWLLEEVPQSKVEGLAKDFAVDAKRIVKHLRKLDPRA